MSESKDSNQTELVTAAGMLYADLVQKRKDRKEAKRAEKEEAELKAIEAEQPEGEVPPQVILTKKEKKERSLDSWKDVIQSLTGDELQFVGGTKKRGGRKKYGKWIKGGDEEDGNNLSDLKPKKKKKINYEKKFDPELKMLQSIVADQNKFNADLAKRFQTLAGVAGKDAGPINKTAVELASAIISGRANSLSIYREIGNLKKTIADLTMKQRKELAESGAFNEQDMTMLGSSLAQSMFGDSGAFASGNAAPSSPPPRESSSAFSGNSSVQSDFAEIDPSSWTGGGFEVDPHIKYESIPTKTYVELNKANGGYKYVTVNTDTGEEIPDYQNPTFGIKSIDEENLVARDDFEKTYELKIVS